VGEEGLVQIMKGKSTSQQEKLSQWH